VERVRRCLKYLYSYLEQPEGIAGGLIILWTKEVEIKVIFSSKEFIDLECKDLERDAQMRITFLHFSTNFQERLALWQQIRNF